MNPNVVRWRGAVENAVAKVYARTGIKVPVALVLGVIETESSGNPEAVSKHGAIGLMQLMPATAKELGVNPKNPRENIYGGTLYLARLRKMFPENWKLAIAAYNAGPGTIRRAGNQIPADREETLKYVPKVLKYMNQYD